MEYLQPDGTVEVLSNEIVKLRTRLKLFETALIDIRNVPSRYAEDATERRWEIADNALSAAKLLDYKGE